jgi:hypothetical protein
VAVPQPPAAAMTTATMTLELHPTGDCWFKLTVDGRPVLSRLMLGASAFSVDGHVGKSLGQPGQVRTARITKETLAQYLE